MELTYSALLPAPPQHVAESAQPYTFFSERHLQALWFEQKYFKGLTTTEGLPITVLSPGLWNGEPGPDFKKAHLIIGNQEVHGDVEIHLSEEGWWQHQHHQDEKYSDVALHIALWSPRKNRQVLTKEGKTMFQVHMESFLTIPLARAMKLIDLDLYPYKTLTGCGGCSHSLFCKLPSEAIQSLFTQAAERRLEQKRLFLSAHAATSELSFPMGLAMGLGYKKNSKPFLQLYKTLSEHTALGEKELFAYALGICGFFAEGHQKKWGDSNYYQELAGLYGASTTEGAPQIPLELHQIRPFNHPIRRIAYLVQMLKDPELQQLQGTLLKIWEEMWPTKKWQALRARLEETCPQYTAPYWNRHLAFCSPESSKDLPLLGSAALQEILVNAFLPILYSEVSLRADPKEKESFEQFYSSFPAQRTGKSRYLKHRFFGDSPKGELMDSAIVEQGTYQLHQDFCLSYEASCEGCPFVENYRQEQQRNSKEKNRSTQEGIL